MKTIAFFNNKGGVGKTTLTYHVAHMMARLGHRTVAVDLDPQANLTSAFLDEDVLERLWSDPGKTATVAGAVKPLLEDSEAVRTPEPIEITDRLHIVAGDLALSAFEDTLSHAWTVRDAQAYGRKWTAAFHTVIERVGERLKSDVVLVDVGPNLGAINRCALLASDSMVVPLAADLFSIQGLRNLGPKTRAWRKAWQETIAKVGDGTGAYPRGTMMPLGYVVLQHAVRLDRPVRAYAKWLERTPEEFRISVLDEADGTDVSVDEDPLALGSIRNYRSLVPMSQEARRPMFDLRSADGAIGSHQRLVEKCYEEFESLSMRILDRAGVARHPRLNTKGSGD